MGGLATNATDGRLYAWSPALDSVKELGGHASGSYRVEAAPTGSPRVVLAARPGIILWIDDHVMQVHRALSLEDRGDQVSAVAWAPDGRQLACGFRNGSVHLFDAENGRSMGALAPHEQQVVDVAWSPDGRIVLTADADCVRVSDAATLVAFDDLRPGWTIETMCLTGDARFVAIGGFALSPGIAPQGRVALLDLASP
jgi:WD40 repeat protein